ncbi:hypothetical protein [Ferriphaselus amnicola]|uniref:hypothetical protein n=1 Tax=Ferriphaselus amnicola TaxID=1188319 RepID=UPI0011AE304C|nr:hypothetical protein [Ferriphaselus amnicola]
MRVQEQQLYIAKRALQEKMALRNFVLNFPFRLLEKLCDLLNRGSDTAGKLFHAAMGEARFGSYPDRKKIENFV